MKKVEAYIRNQKLEDVQTALEDIDILGMTVSDVRGRGHSKGQSHTYRGSTYTLTLNARLKIELLVTDAQVEEVVATILKAATTGEVGDGKITVLPVDDVIRIRTGEHGDTALV